MVKTRCYYRPDRGSWYGMKLSNITHDQGRQELMRALIQKGLSTWGSEGLLFGGVGTSGDSLYGSCGLTLCQGNLEVHLQFWEMQTISWG